MHGFRVETRTESKLLLPRHICDWICVCFPPSVRSSHLLIGSARDKRFQTAIGLERLGNNCTGVYKSVSSLSTWQSRKWVGRCTDLVYSYSKSVRSPLKGFWLSPLLLNCWSWIIIQPFYRTVAFSNSRDRRHYTFSFDPSDTQYDYQFNRQ